MKVEAEISYGVEEGKEKEGKKEGKEVHTALQRIASQHNLDEHLVLACVGRGIGRLDMESSPADVDVDLEGHGYGYGYHHHHRHRRSA